MASNLSAAVLRTNHVALNRSFSGSSVKNGPTWHTLRLMAGKSRKAMKMLRKILSTSTTYVSYVQRIKEVVFADHTVGCKCDFHAFGCKCRRFESKLLRLIEDFSVYVNRPRILKGLVPNLFAKTIVLTAVPA